MAARKKKDEQSTSKTQNTMILLYSRRLFSVYARPRSPSRLLSSKVVVGESRPLQSHGGVCSEVQCGSLEPPAVAVENTVRNIDLAAFYCHTCRYRYGRSLESFLSSQRARATIYFMQSRAAVAATTDSLVSSIDKPINQSSTCVYKMDERLSEQSNNDRMNELISQQINISSLLVLLLTKFNLANARLANGVLSKTAGEYPGKKNRNLTPFFQKRNAPKRELRPRQKLQKYIKKLSHRHRRETPTLQ